MSYASHPNEALPRGRGHPLATAKMRSCMSSELRVPKIRVAVDLAVASGEPRRVELFIAEHRRNAPTRQLVIDLLEEPEPFLPALTEDGFSLYNKDSLAWVSLSLAGGDVPVEEEAHEPEQALFDRQIAVQVELVTGTQVGGELLYSPPPHRGRVVDHLNDVHRFFRLWTPSRLYLVNKNHVLRVVETPAEKK